MQEVKDEMKVMIYQITDFQVEEAVTKVKLQVRKLEIDNELDKKRIKERFEKEIKNMTDYFKNSVGDVRREFTEDLRNI
jgi:hypothetical protein